MAALVEQLFRPALLGGVRCRRLVLLDQVEHRVEVVLKLRQQLDGWSATSHKWTRSVLRVLLSASCSSGRYRSPVCRAPAQLCEACRAFLEQPDAALLDQRDAH